MLKEGGDVLLPLDAECKVFICYSENGKNGEWDIPDAAFSAAGVAAVTAEGNVPQGNVKIIDGKVYLDVKPGQAVVLTASETEDK